jgi:hypothetical protein
MRCCCFQVLVSIQSLILVPEPYFNEPGYEQRGNQQQSKEYNKVRGQQGFLSISSPYAAHCSATLLRWRCLLPAEGANLLVAFLVDCLPPARVQSVSLHCNA